MGNRAVQRAEKQQKNHIKQPVNRKQSFETKSEEQLKSKPTPL